MDTRNFHGKRFCTQTIAITGAARAVVLILFELFANPVAIGFTIAPFHVRDHTLKNAGHLINTATFVIAERDFLFAGPTQENLLDLGVQIFPARVRVKPIMFGNRFDGLQEIRRFTLTPWRQRAIRDFQCHIRHNKAFVEKQLDTQTAAIGTGPKRCVERKQARLDFRNGEPADRTGKVFAERKPLGVAFARRGFQDGDTVGQIQRGSETIGQTGFQPLTHDDAIYHNVDVMAELFVQGGRFIQLIEFAINLNPLKPLFAQFQHFFAVFALAITHNRRQQIAARALVHGHDTVNHVLNLLRFNRQTGRRAIGRSDTGKQKAQIVIDFGHCADRRPRVFRRRFLFDRNRWAEARDMINVRLFHHIKELPRIGA